MDSKMGLKRFPFLSCKGLVHMIRHNVQVNILSIISLAWSNLVFEIIGLNALKLCMCIYNQDH